MIALDKEDISFKEVNYGYQPDELVINQLSMSVPKGAIYGFLGMNGAGKTTTIRLLLGLLKPKNGQILLLGQTLKGHRRKLLRDVGALIESPSIYLHLSAYENLKIACQYLETPYSKIEETLSKVNLLHCRNKLCKTFSTGMKQRLGLAKALISDPDLLILDEPTNGLDPEGIIEVRDLLRHLRLQGKTIFLSSHLLSEIEKIATHVGVIKKGHLVFQGSIEELGYLRSKHSTMHIQSSDSKRVVDLLGNHISLKVLDANNVEMMDTPKEEIPFVIRHLIEAGVDIYEVRQVKTNLETDFLALMEDN